MKRLTTDNPKDNIENSLNLFYGKDEWTWVRGGGPAPDYADISLCDFVRMLAKANIPDAELPEDDDDLSDLMCDWLIDEPDSAEGIISLLYTAGWAFAELRHRLAAYEDLEEQGRLVVLPCKVGTPVYTTRWWDEVPETCIDSKGKKFQRMTTKHKVTKEEFSPFSLDYVQFGEKVFLTREEAERALEGGTDNG